MEDEESFKQPENNITKHHLDGTLKLDSKLIHLTTPIIVPPIMSTIIDIQKTLEPFNKIAAVSEKVNRMGTIFSSSIELSKTVNTFQDLSQKHGILLHQYKTLIIFQLLILFPKIYILLRPNLPFFILFHPIYLNYINFLPMQISLFLA